MALSINLPFWPVSLDTLKWSRHNLIAVGGSDSVAILIPKLKTVAVDEPRWAYVLLKINVFSSKDLPVLEPMSMKYWSIGEELSQRYVLALDWSRGIGHFQSCVLAILHSDYTLDLWEYSDRPEIGENWKRCCVISKTLREYYASIHKRGNKQIAQQVRSRVRSFSWCPQAKSSSQLLAISTEAGDILILKVQSPYDVLSYGSRSWSVTILHRFECAKQFPGTDQFENNKLHQDNRKVIEHLLWSKFGDTDVLAFIVDGALNTISLEDLPERSEKMQFKKWTPDGEVMEGPVVATSDGLVWVSGDFIAYQRLHSRPTQYHLERRWSNIAGLMVLSTNSTTTIMPAIHLGYERQRPGKIVISENTVFQDEDAEALVSTQQALKLTATQYERKQDLFGGVHTRTWGICASPTGGQIAVCSTLLPAASPAHVIQSEQFCEVHISKIASTKLPVHQYLDITTVLFSIQGDLLPSTSHEDVKSILQQVLQPQALSDSGESSISVLRTVLARADRYEDMRDRLTAILQKQKYKSLMPTTWYLAFTGRVLEIGQSLEQGALSKKIVDMYKSMQAKLDTSSVEYIPEQAEECSVCRQPLLVEAIKWARCSADHRFTRCTLTFLALQPPGISKSCSICGAQYLNEYKIDDLGYTSVEGALIEPLSSLARMLFAVVDRCVLCNGRFIS